LRDEGATLRAMTNTTRSVTPRLSGPSLDGERLATLTVDGRAFAYQDVGRGPTVILAHCSSASHKEWATLVATLADRYRVLAPDLLGYGRSEPWPVNARLHPWSDLGALLALAQLAGEPVHLGGHSYGGTVALEAARVLGPRVKSLTLIEPVAFHLLGLTGRTRESEEVNAVGRRLTEALRRRRDREAASVYMTYWAGRMKWWAMSPKARRRVVQTVGKVGAEFEMVSHLSRTAGDYRSIHTPTRLIVGERSPRPARAIVYDLLKILPDAHAYELARAGHMSPITHPAVVATLVAEHIDAVEGKDGQVSAASA
jgi:pimeloyl-ACP methyl ester carboxylesterase